MHNTSTPPLPPKRNDAKHLRVLSIFHFIAAGLSLLGLGFIFLHYSIMCLIIKGPIANEPGIEDFRALFPIFKFFYIFSGVALVIIGIGNLLSGIFLRQQKHRIFTLIVAGLNCFNIPAGTVLAVFTFIILLRSSVAELYRAQSKKNSPVPHDPALLQQ